MRLSRRQILLAAGYLGLDAIATSLWHRPKLAIAERLSDMSLKVQLDWKFNAQFAGLLLADKVGLYAEQNIHVDLLPWQTGIAVPETVATHPRMLGCTEQNLILAAQAAGAPIKVLATMFQASPLGLMTLPDSEITTLDDLKGQTVGMHVDGLAVMELVQGINGLPLDAIEAVEIPYENKYERLLSGELSAVQCYAVDEPIGFRRQYGIEPSVLKLADYGYDAYAQVIFAHNDLLDTAPEQVSSFLQGTFNGWTLALADIPTAAAQIVADYVDSDSRYNDLVYQGQSLALIAEYMLFGIESTALGTLSRDRWMHMAQQFVEYGMLEVVPDLEDSLAPDFGFIS